MPYSLEDKLVVGITSRALFDLDAANRVYEDDGLNAYREYQAAHENDVLSPGTAFPLVKGLLRINTLTEDRLVEVIVISRNDAETGLRMLNSIEHHELEIERMALTDGRDPWPYLAAFNCNLFLSAHGPDVTHALANGHPAARILGVPEAEADEELTEVRIAFDGDAVLFSPESERIYQDEGLEAFLAHEVEHADEPLEPGPLKPFLDALQTVQSRFSAEDSPIRLALVTARNMPAHRRVIRTLRDWGVPLNEAFFLGGVKKSAILEVLRPHIFFDDQLAHLEPASATTPSAEVPPPLNGPG